MSKPIQQSFSHSLTLNKLEIENLDQRAINRQKDRPSMVEDENWFGFGEPVVSIRGVEIASDGIESFEIDCNGKIPQINLKLSVQLTHYLSRNILRDKEIISLFVRSSNNEKKKIRIDFFIRNIVKKTRGDRYMLSIVGEMYIPRLYASTNGSYNGTSINVLKSVAKELKLGFGSNINYTNDEMIWISVNDRYIDFINYVVLHSWIDDQKFMDWYIDPYYNLVFYEVNSSLKYDEISVLAYRKLSNTKSGNEDKKSVMEWVNAFSDTDELIATDHGIANYRLVNNTEISLNGYVKENVIVDYEDQSVIRFESETIADINDGVPLKSRLDDNNYSIERNVEYIGVQNDNMHANYRYAMIHNRINNVELNKIYIDMDTTDLNLNYVVGDNVGLYVSDIRMNLENSNPLQDKTAFKSYPNLQLSNNYKIHGISYKYKNGVFYNRYRLTRREWPIEEV